MILALALISPAASIQPAAGAAQPPPVTHLDYDPDLQRAWAPRAASLQDRWGRWWVRWDQRNGTPRALLGGGVPEAAAPDFVAAIARMGGVEPSDLVWVGPRNTPQGAGGATPWRYVQTWRGATIVGAEIAAWSEAGQINGAFASLHRPDLDLTPRPGEVVLPLEGIDGRLRYHLVQRAEEGDEVVYRDRAGAEVLRYTTRLHLDVTLQERTIGDALIQAPARDVYVTDGASGQQTADDGAHGLSGTIDAYLSGSYLAVYEYGASVAEALGVDDDVLDGGEDISLAAATSQHHFHEVRDWLLDRRPAHPWLGDLVPSTVNVSSGSCNAYYTGGTINFYVGNDTSCHNFGEIADVVYHEYGHGVHDYVIEAGTFASDVSEGSADFISATILDDYVLAPNATPSGDFIRELSTDKRYPDDFIGQVHNDGLIWGSFLWNLRESWIDTYGYEDGTRRVDELFLETLSYGPELTDLYEAVLLSDDDDGDLSNATPHACELLSLLDQHGLGPGPMGLVRMEHVPLESQPSFDPYYPLSFSLFDVTPECGGFDPDSARVWYAVDPDGYDPADFKELIPDRDGQEYTSALPRQVPGAELVYFITWESEGGEVVESSHGDDERHLYRFLVGDRSALWCEDFESGWGEWTHGPGVPFAPDLNPDWSSEWEIATPAGEDSFTPDAAWSGDYALGTAFGAEYDNDNLQYAFSPEIWLDASEVDDRLFLLSARRWLTVEDGYYDQAELRLYQDEQYEIIWSNYASPSWEGASQHTLDADWVEHDVDLRGWVDFSRSVRFAWVLRSDAGLEFGGWALDDVCVVTLDDVPGHYRVRDLSADVDEATGAVTLRWSQPYVAPLSHAALVRKEGAFPESISDGLILDMRAAPEPGDEVEVIDAALTPGVDYHYAVFAAAEGVAFYGEVVEGENGVVAGLEIGEEELTDTGDALAPEPEPEPEGGPTELGHDPDARGSEVGSSCASAPAAASGWMALLALAAARRGRRRGRDTG